MKNLGLFRRLRMNMKYISLLSLFSIVAVNAAKLPATDQLDQAKKALVACYDYTPYSNLFDWGCKNRREEFAQAKKEFVAPHKEKMEAGIKKYQEQSKNLANAYFWQKKRLEKERRDTYLETWGHGWIYEALEGRSDYDFFRDNKSTVEFSKHILTDRYCAGQSSYVEDMMGNKIIWQVMTDPSLKPHVDAAREKVMQVVHEQTKSPE